MAYARNGDDDDAEDVHHTGLGIDRGCEFGIIRLKRFDLITGATRFHCVNHMLSWPSLLRKIATSVEPFTP